MINNLENFFDMKFYYKKYPDIEKSMYKDNPLKHFKEFGYKENREPCDLDYIDWGAYIINNNLKKDLNFAKEHFISKGIFDNNVIIKYNNLEKEMKNYNSEFYKNNNLDLKNLNENELFLHFKKYGFHENRIFYDKSLKKKLPDNILDYKYDSNNNLYKFNIESYRKNNIDLDSLCDDDLIEHFINFGFKEKRLFCQPINEFDYEYYLKNNSDIKLNYINNNDLCKCVWKHYLYHGYFEGKTYNKNHKNTYLNNIKNIKNINKTLVIYVYYNRPGEYKNETNLSFFINQTIKKRDSIKDNIEFLFIINNYYTEVKIPTQKNIYILKNKNSMDFEAYLLGIKYIEKKYSRKIDKLYDNVMFMNCSCTGPFINDNSFWLQKFYNKLNEYTVCCSSILTFINTESCIFGPQIPGYLFLIKSNYIHLLIKHNNILKNNRSFSNTVIGPKKNKYDCIISGEHCISKVLLQHNLNIASICNDNLDYRQKKNYHFLKFNADRHNIFNFSLYKSIFIKNHWRIDNSNRDCYPVMWSQTKKEIEILNNMFFINYKNNILNYNLLSINNTGTIRFNKSSWKSKDNFGDIFSDSEELITFPKSNCTKTINYFHNDKHSDNKLQRYIIEGIKSLLYLNYRINFYTNLKKPFNFNIPDSINIIYTNRVQNNIIFNNQNVGTDLLFPCTNFETFEKEIKDNKFEESIIKIQDLINNKDKYLNNKYINFLTMYW